MKANRRQNEVWVLIFLLGLGYFLFFHNLSVRYLWNPCEDEYVLVNREMVEDGHWFYPTANGQPYSIKPPLFNWIGSLISVFYGEVNVFTSRLPSPFAALIVMFLIYYFGKYLFGPRAGLISAMVLATSPLYIRYAQWIQINMIATMLLSFTLVLFYIGYKEPRRRRWAYLLMYVAMGLGTLNMGPVNLVMPVIVIGIYLFLVKDIKHISQLRIGWGMLIYLLIVAPWYVAVSLKGGYANDLIITSNLTRFFGDFTHSKPFYHYIASTPPYFLPWSLFFPVAFYLCFSEKTREDRKLLLFPFVWTSSLFVFFSLSICKRSGYMLVIFPALALLVGYMLDRGLLYWKDSLFWRKALLWPTYTVLVGAGLIAVGLPVYCWIKAPDWFGLVLPLAIMLLVGVAVASVFLHKRRFFEALITCVIVIAAVIAYGSGPVIAKANNFISAKSFCLKVKERIPEGETLKMFHFYLAVYPYYTERFVEVLWTPPQLLDWFRQNKRVYAISKEEDYEEIADTFEVPIYVIERQWVRKRYMLLLSNQPESNDGREEHAPEDSLQTEG